MRKPLIAAVHLALLAMVVVAGEGSRDRINMAGIRDSQTREFLARFQDAVRAGDSRGVAQLIRFPALVAIGDEPKDMGKTEFLLKYDEIMTPDLVEAVLSAKFDDLIINSDGVGLPLGIVWFSGLCSDSECRNYTIRVITINGLSKAQSGPRGSRSNNRLNLTDRPVTTLAGARSAPGCPAG